MIITDDMYIKAQGAYINAPGAFEHALRAALEAALAAIPLDAASVERCAKALDERAAFWGRGDIRTQERMEVEYCARLLRALPVVPPRPTPTREAVARAMCCPSGVCGFPGNPKLCNRHYFDTDGLSAVLALFGKGGA